MSTKRVRFAVLAVLVVFASLAVAACGSDDNSTSKQAANGAIKKTLPTGAKGGSVTALSAGDVDYMDPGQQYYTFGYQIGYSVNRPLYYFSPADSSKQIPDVAAGEPTIAADGKSMDDQDQAGHQVLAAGQSRGRLRRHQVRLRALVQRERSERVRDAVLRRHRRCSEEALQGRPGHLGHHLPG